MVIKKTFTQQGPVTVYMKAMTELESIHQGESLTWTVKHRGGSIMDWLPCLTAVSGQFQFGKNK